MSAFQAVIVVRHTARFSHLPHMSICPLLLTKDAAAADGRGSGSGN